MAPILMAAEPVGNDAGMEKLLLELAAIRKRAHQLIYRGMPRQQAIRQAVAEQVARDEYGLQAAS